MADVRDYHPSIYDKDALRRAVASHSHLCAIDLREEGEQLLVSVHADDGGPDAAHIADSIGNHALLLTARAARTL